ncbi:hypothetical protein SGPA1_40184 [Streptomyces misionensis JCM 4497]
MGPPSPSATRRPFRAHHGPSSRSSWGATAAWWGRSHGRRVPRPVLHVPAVRGARRRATVRPAAAIAVVAATGPAVWLVVCCAVLLVAHRLVTDARTVGVTAPARPPAGGTRADGRRLDRSRTDRRPGTGRGRLMATSAGLTRHRRGHDVPGTGAAHRCNPPDPPTSCMNPAGDTNPPAGN